MSTVLSHTGRVAVLLVVGCAAGRAAGQSAYQTTVVGQNPTQYWRLNETSGTTAANLLGTGTAGEYVGGVTLGQPGPRPPTWNGFEAGNNAPAFNGTDAFVNTTISPFNGQTAFSMSGWFFQAANQPANRIGLFGQNDVAEFGFINPNTIEFWSPGTGGVQAPWDGSLNNRWNHLAAVADGTNGVRVYLNGALVATDADPVSGNSSADTSRIGGGGIYDTTGNFYLGQIDEVAVFDRVLSEAEVQAQFFAPVPEPSLTLAVSGLALAAVAVGRHLRPRRAMLLPRSGSPGGLCYPPDSCIR
jgi:hypothetical protein